MNTIATTIDRRRLLLGTGATAAGLGALSVLPASTESTIVTLFREWERLYRAACNLDLPEDEAVRLLDAMREHERQICSLPATSATDFAAKLVAFTNYGDFMLTPANGVDLVREAVELIGATV